MSMLMGQIEHVSDTARWVAVDRAIETERGDVILRDRFAARPAGEKGEAIVDNMKRGRSIAWAMLFAPQGSTARACRCRRRSVGSTSIRRRFSTTRPI